MMSEDDGVSLSPTQFSQLWTPYYQGEKYLTGEEDGVGLGLVMVASLIWTVGETCRAYNREEQPGMVVKLHIPPDTTFAKTST
ncbi:hypothetical protein CSA56_03905 [candidate division KSB3 bacterium]|uniref:Histidine kinase/HSP90-like ATPase domain-containing protein n=1 Tax=candidate division KSB3 bacterium TaxID=2044937 RepID=A0A2G6KIJ9_9BACT|nr:MAG: hypothetical protein CSA56_03905 [candidate division KSB3 bacterium]